MSDATGERKLTTRWVTSAEAAAILSETSGRPISSDYVRVLARNGVIRYRQNPKDASTNQYNAEDCEHYRVRGRTEKRGGGQAPNKRRGKPIGRPRKQQPEEEKQADQ